MSKKYFILTLLLFYFIIFFSPNKIIYFGAYFISTFMFYLASKNIRLSLLYSLILSFFSDVGLAGSLFLMEPKELNLGSGLWISPTTILALILLPMSLRKKIQSVKKTDLFVIIFLVWNIFVFLNHPYTNVLYGIIKLGEILLTYNILRIYISKEALPNISFLLISILFFQSLLGGLQFLFQRNLGILLESSNLAYPFGLATVEERSLFRISGTFGHANMFAVVIITLLPFLFIYNNYLIDFIKIIAAVILVFTYSRSAWMIGFPLFILLSFKNIKNFFYTTLKHKFIIKLASIILIVLLLFPILLIRFNTTYQAFDEYGSFGVRVKIYQEAFNLIKQNPLFGVGINRFQQVASENPITDIFQVTKYSAGTRVHNLFLELATEIGIIGLLIFLIFIYTVMKYYLNNKANISKKVLAVKTASFYGLIVLFLISMFHPFYLIIQFRLFFLLSAIILA